MEIAEERSSIEICSHIVRFGAEPRAFHWHENCEICQPLQKPCRFLVDGRRIDAGPGDIVVINAQTVHRFLLGHDGTDVRIFQFRMKILLDAGVSVQPLQTHITADEIRSRPGLEEKIQRIFGMMEQEERLESGEKNPFLRSMAAALYFLLMREFAAPEADLFAAKKERREFYRIAGYINDHFTEDITIQSLAKCLYISRGRLASVFFRYSGTGVNEYIHTLRVRNVNRLLDCGCTAAEAALESGFQSIRTFNNVYKKKMGCTPSEYMKRKSAE